MDLKILKGKGTLQNTTGGISCRRTMFTIKKYKMMLPLLELNPAKGDK